MCSKSDNAKIMMSFETDDIINELFEFSLNKYEEGLEIKMRGRDFVFESADSLQYHIHKISLNRGGSYVDSPDWIKHKRATINPKNKDNGCFKYAVTIALKHENINNQPERISNLKPLFDQYNWKNIEFPSHSKEWKQFEQNNKTIILNILFVPYNTKQIRQAYLSKYNHKRDNQVILLMIINDNKNWHYLTVKSLSRLLTGITSNHDGDFYCLNCLDSCRTKNKLKRHEKVCKNYDYCYVEMPKEDKKY